MLAAIEPLHIQCVSSNRSMNLVLNQIAVPPLFSLHYVLCWSLKLYTVCLSLLMNFTHNKLQFGNFHKSSKYREML